MAARPSRRAAAAAAWLVLLLSCGVDGYGWLKSDLPKVKEPAQLGCGKETIWCGQCALGVTGRLLKKIAARQIEDKEDPGSIAEAHTNKEKVDADKLNIKNGAEPGEWDFSNPEINFWNTLPNARATKAMDGPNEMGLLEMDSTETVLAKDGRFHVKYGTNGATIDQLSRDAARLFARRGVRVHPPRHAADNEWPHAELAALLETGKIEEIKEAPETNMESDSQADIDKKNGIIPTTGGRSDIQNIPGGPGWDDDQQAPKWHEYSGYHPDPDDLPLLAVPTTNSDDAKDNFMSMLNAEMCLHGPGVDGPATTAHEQLAEALFSSFLKQDNVEPKCFIPGLTDIPTLPPTSMFRGENGAAFLFVQCLLISMLALLFASHSTK